ncbi:MAG: hypothetical protein ACI8PT_004713, partial [Gammaproteobacteria bacterium]
GNSPGTLMVQGDYQQGADAALFIELGGTEQGVKFDYLDISGQATIEGRIEVSLVDSFSPLHGASFEFLSALGGVLGVFNQLTCTNCIGTGVSFEVEYGTNFANLNAVVAPVPLPGAVWLLLSALGVFVGIRQRRKTI